MGQNRVHVRLNFPLSVWRWITFHFDSTLPEQTKSECSTEAWLHVTLEIQWWVTLMSFIYIHICILRIWTILSLHESTHLIGTKSIQIRIGKEKRQRKTVRYFASNDYQNLYHFLQAGKSTAAPGKGKFVRERTENNPTHITGLYQAVFWVPWAYHRLSWRQKIAKRASGPSGASLRVNNDHLVKTFSLSCHKQQPFSLNWPFFTLLGSISTIQKLDLSSSHWPDKMSRKQRVSNISAQEKAVTFK